MVTAGVTPGVTPDPKSNTFNIAASESGEDVAPEKLDFEGGSGIVSGGKRLNGKQAAPLRVKPPRSRSRSDPDDIDDPEADLSADSLDSRQMLTKNQRKKLREKAAKVRKTTAEH